jgi:hypothetical protein
LEFFIDRITEFELTNRTFKESNSNLFLTLIGGNFVKNFDFEEIGSNVTTGKNFETFIPNRIAGVANASGSGFGFGAGKMDSKRIIGVRARRKFSRPVSVNVDLIYQVRSGEVRIFVCEHKESEPLKKGMIEG